MSSFDGFRYRLDALRRALFRRAEWQAELDDEMAFHMDLEAMHQRHAGASDRDAQREARRRFGHPARVRERVVDATGVSAFDALRQDLKFAVRTLRASPGFTIVACITLALGIGATTSTFSVVSAVLLRPLPYQEGERIVTLGEHTIGAAPTRAMTTSYPNFADWQQATHAFESMGLYSGWGPALTGNGEPARVKGALITSGIFDVLRVTPALGRPMRPSDNAPNAALVVVLSNGLWRRRFAADPGIIGTSITLNGTPRTVIAVLPRGFRGPGILDADVWGSNSFDASDGRDARYLGALARLAPATSLTQARTELRTISRRLAAQYPKENGGLEAIAVPLREHVVGDATRTLWLLLGASGLVLLVACANLSNLLIARGLARGREFALRVALGAGRGRVVRQLLVESTVVASLGAVLGTLLGAVAVRGAMRLAPDVVRAQPLTLDARVVAFALLVLVITGTLAGLLPALHAGGADPQATLKAGGRGTTGGLAMRARDLLAVAQLALALALVSSAGLLVKSLVRLQHVDPGIAAGDALAMSMNLAPRIYPAGREWPMYDRVLQRVTALPGVQSAAVTSALPLDGSYDHVSIDVYGQPVRGMADKLDAQRFIVSADYFKTLGITLVAGRLFEATDDVRHPRVAVVDETFARQLAPNGSPIGMRISHGDTTWTTIVGVTRTVRHAGLDAAPVGLVYEAMAQESWRWVSLVVRAAPGTRAESLAPAVRASVRAVDPNQPVWGVTTMAEVLARQGAPKRFVLLLLGAFAGAALVLAAVGLYGVMAYAVAQRRRELGVRVSLGATPRDVRQLVVGRAVILALYGGVLGALASVGGAGLLARMLYDVRPADAGVLTGAAGVLLIVAIIAGYAPARRAARTDPAVVLRGD